MAQTVPENRWESFYSMEKYIHYSLIRDLRRNQFRKQILKLFSIFTEREDFSSFVRLITIYHLIGSSGGFNTSIILILLSPPSDLSSTLIWTNPSPCTHWSTRFIWGSRIWESWGRKLYFKPEKILQKEIIFFLYDKFKNKKFFIKTDCKNNLKRASMERWQCPINNGTLEAFI